jgi:hypothetical protein
MTPRTEPLPWLHCSRCRDPRPFRSSGRIRVNANGRRIDAWLIYRCTGCDATWNRPIVERREVASLDRPFLQSLQSNDAILARALALDTSALRRWTDRVQECDEVQIVKRVLEPNRMLPLERLEIECRVPHPIALRADRLLANELRLSRNAVQRMARTAKIRTVPAGADLRRPVRDGMRIIFDLRNG